MTLFPVPTLNPKDHPKFKGRYTERGVSNGGLPDLDLSFLFCPFLSFFREVLNGIGAHAAVKLQLFALALGEQKKNEEKKGETTKKSKEMGNPSDPIYTNPIKNLPTFRDFAGFFRDFPISNFRGFSRFVLFLFLGLLVFLTAPARNSPGRVGDTIRTFLDKSGIPPETPRFGNPRLIFGDGLSTVSESTVSSTELSEFFRPHRVPGRELSEFLSAYYLCAKASSFSQNSPSLPQTQ